MRKGGNLFPRLHRWYCFIDGEQIWVYRWGANLGPHRREGDEQECGGVHDAGYGTTLILVKGSVFKPLMA